MPSPYPATGTLTTQDRVRQVAVTLSEGFCLLGTLVGLGVLGKRVEESSGGALAADATLVAPAGPAFSIWSIVYLGLAAYTIWQWLPGNAITSRTRHTGWLVGASMILNAVWLLVTQQGWIWVSVGVIALLLVTLVLILRQLTIHPPANWVERVIVDGTFGLYAGWVAVATCANLMAAVVDSGFALPGSAGELAAVTLLIVAVAAGAALAWRAGARLAVAAAMAWGLAWIAVGRLRGEPASLVVGVSSVIAAAIVIILTLVALRQRRAVPAR